MAARTGVRPDDNPRRHWSHSAVSRYRLSGGDDGRDYRRVARTGSDYMDSQPLYGYAVVFSCNPGWAWRRAGVCYRDSDRECVISMIWACGGGRNASLVAA